jgi:hypothetical protein
MRLDPRAAAKAALGYLKRNPDELLTAATNAAKLRFGVPTAALRWLADQASNAPKAPQDIELATSNDSLRVSAAIDAMGTPIRASASIRIDEIRLNTDELRVSIRLSDIKLMLLGESDTPLALLIKSGALDLSRPGNLLKYLPKRPPVIVEADGDRVVLDFMRMPAIANNSAIKKALDVITPVLGIRAIETDSSHVYVALEAAPWRASESLQALIGS